MSTRLDFVLRVGAQYAAAAHRAAPTAGFDDQRPIPREAMDRALQLLNQADLYKYMNHGLRWWKENGATVSDAELYKLFRQLPKETLKEAQSLMDLSDESDRNFAVSTLLHRLWENRYDERGVRIEQEDGGEGIQDPEFLDAIERFMDHLRQPLPEERADYIHPAALPAVQAFVASMPTDELRRSADGYFSQHGLRHITMLIGNLAYRLLLLENAHTDPDSILVDMKANDLIDRLRGMITQDMGNNEEYLAALEVRNRVFEGLQGLPGMPNDHMVAMLLASGGLNHVATTFASRGAGGFGMNVHMHARMIRTEIDRVIAADRR